MTGKYLLTTKTVNVLLRAGYLETKTSSILFFSDGRFQMVNMPGCWLREPLSGGSADGGPIRRSYDSGSGVWKISDCGLNGFHSWGIQLNFHDTTGIKSTQSKIIIGSLRGYSGPMLRNEKPPYILHFVVGDPDGGESLELYKGDITKNENAN